MDNEKKPIDSQEMETEETSPIEEKAVEIIEKNITVKKTGFFSSQRFKHGGAATALTAGFIVVVILVNVVVSLLGDRFPSMNIDMTAGSVNTLSDDAVKVVDAVKLPTTITILVGEEDAKNDNLNLGYGFKYSQVSILASKMSERNSNISVKYIDLDKQPTFSSNYAGENMTTGCVLVESERRYRLLQLTDLYKVDTDYQQGTQSSFSQVDGALASAVNQVNSEKLPKVAFATGHQEMLPVDGMKQLLGNNSFDAVDFNLMTDEIPAETQLIVLPTPTTDYTQEELVKIDKFLNDNTWEATRSVIVTFYPSQEEMPNLTTFMKEWGMEVSTDVVLESDSNKVIPGTDGSLLFATVESEVQIGKENTEYGNVISPRSRPVNRVFESQAGVSTYPLLSSSDTSFLYTQAEDGKTPETESYTIGAVGQKFYSINNRAYTANVIALGSSEMITASYMNASAYGNGKYTLDLVKYATGTTDDDMGVAIQKVETNVSDITLSASASNFLGVFIFTLLPLFGFLIAGIVVYLKRRHL